MCTETPKHLFWDCIHSQNFWSGLSSFLDSINFQCAFNFQNICFGLLNDSPKNNILNFIILYSKYYIYSCKLNNSIPCLNNFKHKLRRRIEIGKQIALNHDKLEEHDRKWRLFNDSL